MKVSFDLISDLHLETWDQPIDFFGLPTSVVCVVAGDIARDRDIVLAGLEHLSQCYKIVLYVDGNEEHKDHLDNLNESYADLIESLSELENVVYLRDNVAVIDGVGFIGVNGWWTYDLQSNEDYDYSKLWFMEKYNIDYETANSIETMATEDAGYLYKSMEQLQTHKDIKHIVVVTHTVPAGELIAHDSELDGTHKINCFGNVHIINTLSQDTENKIKAWCFGHYHNEVDTEINGIRFVNNCRGRGNTPHKKSVYYPKNITLDL